MARDKESARRDPHRRFAEWLETHTEEDPPRDLAVHAAVCAACQQRIAALDMLTAIDPAAAGIPPQQALATRGWLRTTGRAAVMVGGLAALLAVGIGSWRLIQASALLGPAIESPTQAVLGGTGLPEPTATSSVLPTEPASTVEPMPSQPGGTERPPQGTPPPVVVLPTPPPAVPTVQPTVRQTATPRPTRTPAPTQAPTPPPTPPPTPTPEPPTPEPTPTPKPGPP